MVSSDLENDDEESIEEEEEEEEDESEDYYDTLEDKEDKQNNNNLQESNNNINDLLVLASLKDNPCACLKRNKCNFRDFVIKTKIDLQKEDDLLNASKLLDSTCINDGCPSKIWSFCYEINKSNQPIKTKCKICVQAKTTDKFLFSISNRQE